MRSQGTSLGLSAFLALPSLVSAVTFDCSHLRIDGQSFDLSELKGPHAVHQIVETPPSVSNTTFTVDICNPLEIAKNIPKEDRCPSGTRICAIEESYNPADNSHTITKVIPIAGEYATSHGRHLDPVLTRLKNSASHSDSGREGVRVEFNGGSYPFEKSKGLKEKAIIEFVCDPDRTGLEHVENKTRTDSKDEKKEEKRAEGGEDKGKEGDEDDETKPEDEPSLQFVSFNVEGEPDRQVQVLRLNWRTKYACEGKTEHAPSSKSNHWGFFTWFLIIVFLVVAAYLIFGSWLNYNRYGARGWDLIPHGDTIRDMPYLVKDWGRSIVNTVQGHGSRGGYAAV